MEMPEHNNYMQSVVIGRCDTVLMGQTYLGRGEDVVEEKRRESLVETLKRKGCGKTKQ